MCYSEIKEELKQTWRRVVTRFGASRGNILPYGIHRGNAARRVWRIFATRFIALRIYIERTRVNASSMYSTRQLPQEGYGTSWNKCGMGNEGGTRKKDRRRQTAREREKKGVARVSSFWASNWNNGNWLTSNEYSIGLFEQWEKNIRRRACVDTTKDMCVTFPIPSSGSLGNTRENGEKRKKGSG